LRQNQTDAEALLWSKLRSRQLLDLKFRRQHAIGSYFADFVCIEIGLIVELDGGQHSDAEAIAYDAKRSSELAAMGLRVLRFWNNEVLQEKDGVLERIREVALTLTPTLSRKREREQSGAQRSQ
jgi:very-short-patch-repair endonuclease